MKFYVEALTPDGEDALKKEMEERTWEQRIKERIVVKIKIENKNPYTLSFKPTKAVLLSVNMMGTLSQYKKDFERELCLGIEKNGASKQDYKVRMEGGR